MERREELTCCLGYAVIEDEREREAANGKRSNNQGKAASGMLFSRSARSSGSEACASRSLAFTRTCAHKTSIQLHGPSVCQLRVVRRETRGMRKRRTVSLAPKTTASPARVPTYPSTAPCRPCSAAPRQTALEVSAADAVRHSTALPSTSAGSRERARCVDAGLCRVLIILRA